MSGLSINIIPILVILSTFNGEIAIQYVHTVLKSHIIGRKYGKLVNLCHSNVSLPGPYFLHFGGPSEQFDIYEESIYSYKVDLKSINHPNLFSDRFSITFPD